MKIRNLFVGGSVATAMLHLAVFAGAQDKTAVAQSDSPTAAGQCPVIGVYADASARTTAAGALSNSDWWPNQLNLKMLHQNSLKGNPLGADFNYADEFKKLDLAYRRERGELEEGEQ